MSFATTEINEDAIIKAYAEAHGCGGLRLAKLTDEQLKKWEDMIEREPSYIHIETDSPVRPLPCVRDEHGEIKEQTVKRLFTKINEELDEFKAVVFYSCDVYDPNCLPESCDDMIHTRIAEEAADTITAITTMLEALGIDAEMRDEAQRRVNSKNRERGRL